MADRALKKQLILFGLLFFWICFLAGYPGWRALTAEGWAPLTVFLLALSAVVLLDGRHRSGLLEPGDWRLWLLVVALAGGLLVSNSQEVANRIYLNLITLLLVLYYVGKAWGRQPRLWRPICWIVVGMGLIEAGYGILEWAIGTNPLYEYLWSTDEWEFYRHSRRPLGTQFNMVPLGTLMVACLPFTLDLLRDDRWGRALCYAGTLAMVTCLVLTSSRGPFLALVVMWIVHQLLRRRGKTLAIGLLAVSAFVLVSTRLPGNHSRLGYRGIFTSSNGVFSEYRLVRVRMALAMFQTRPLVGLGFLEFNRQFDVYYSHEETPKRFRIADNMYLTLLAETGLLGTVAFLLFVGGLSLDALRELSRVSPRAPPGQVAILFAVFVGLLFGLAHYELLYVTGPAMLFCLICGLLSGSLGRVRAQEGPDNHRIQ